MDFKSPTPSKTSDSATLSEPSSRATCRSAEIDSALHTPWPLRNPNCKVASRLSSTNLLRHLESNLSKTLDKTMVTEIILYSEGDEDGLSSLGNGAIFSVFQTNGKLASLTNLWKIVAILGRQIYVQH